MQTKRKHNATPPPLWGSPAGKMRIAKQLASLLPAHTTYVEPFAGGAAVFYAKDRASTEVLNDIDPDIGNAFRVASTLSPVALHSLRHADWLGSKATFDRLKKTQADDDVGGLHRFMYLSKFSFLKGRRYFSPSTAGTRVMKGDQLERGAARLKGTIVETCDYEQVVKKHDGESTAFFFDPPYVDASVGVGEKDFDETRFFDVLKGIRGKFLLTYGSGGDLAERCKEAGFCVRQHYIKHNLRVRKCFTGHLSLATYLIANYDLPSVDTQSVESERFEKSVALVKSMPSERFILGVVLEPDTVDAHGDIYSAAEIRKAAHGFMQNHQTVGEMHRWDVSETVKLVESYLLPCDMEVEEQTAQRGTWMFGLRVLDDDIWARVQSGKLTGLSIGGYATRTPVDASISTEARVTKAAAANQKRRLFSLTDFDIREVSLVDSAANNRKYLIAKRSNTVDPAEAEPSNDDLPEGSSSDARAAPVGDSDFKEFSTEVLGAVRSMNERLATLEESTKKASTAVKDDAEDDTTAVTVTEMQKRLVRLEKRFDLPSSVTSEAAPTKGAEFSWPYDININRVKG